MVLVVGSVIILAMVPVSILVSGHSATGGVNNVAPNFTQVGTVTMTVNPTTVDNSGADTIEFDAKFYEANGDDDDEIVQSSCTLTVYEGADNGGTQVLQWTGVWDASPGPTEFVIDPTGTQDDGFAFITDSAGGTDEGFVWTVPSTLTGSSSGVEHYVELVIEDDDGLNASTGANFNVRSAIQIAGVYRQDGIPVDTVDPYDWNFPDSNPGTRDVSSGDGPNTHWLVVQNAGSNPTDSFAVTFIDDHFESPTTLEQIPIDGEIDFEYYESNQAPGGTDDPNEHGSKSSVVDDADGIWNNADFTAINNYIWIRYEIDIPDISGDSNDYRSTFTVAAD